MSLRGVIVRAVVLTLGCLYGLVAAVKLLVRIVRRPDALVKKDRTTPPGCLLDGNLGQHGYVYLEKIRMHYVSNGAQNKPLMLLLHGFPEFWYSWRNQLKDFNDEYRVVAVDLRGYGETDKPPGIASYALPLLVEDVRQFITVLGYKRCVLVGHDWGGAISWALADRYPELVSHLVVLNCPDIRSFQRHLQSSFSQFKRSWYMFLFQLPWLPEWMLQVSDFRYLEAMFRGRTMGVKCDRGLTDQDIEAYKYNYTRYSFTEPINYIRAGFSVSSLSRKVKSEEVTRSKGITMPTLIVWGEDDGALDKALAAMASQRCKGKVTIKYIENCSHWVQMDRPDLVNRYIRQFLSGC
ncbi:epoxide hydrolase 1-like [Babylonia areolata]|uniref:epoxide hydrolase 1-like n=1 Tax=Babylonia areolata TaxID=304850 RepID=UPI003FCF3F77